MAQSARQANPLLTTVPQSSIASVEHPCVIKYDIEKAVSMLGGSSAIAQALKEDSDTTFALSFHPEDPAARTIIANKKQADNVLLQITTPRRTGRKRKRGADKWIDGETPIAPTRSCEYLFQSLRDHPNNHSIQALSSVSSMHIWRSMPDFGYSTQGLPLLDEVKSTLLSQQYPAIRKFKMSLTHGLEDTTTLPPVVWSQQSIPNNYTYRQNPNTKVLEDPTTGQQTIHNTQAAPRIYSYQMQWDAKEYPTSPDPKLLPLEDQSDVFKQTVASLKTLFEDRPLWTRRALLNSLKSELSSFNMVRFCLAYVAFALRSGPWRDTYCRFGVDPRKDPRCRVYQTIMLQLVPKENLVPTSKYRTRDRNGPSETGESSNLVPGEILHTKRMEDRQNYARSWALSSSKESHIFNGVSAVPPDGKIWQLCDLAHPSLSRLRDLEDDQIRTECETRYYGWYFGGTIAKLRIGLKIMVDALQSGLAPDMQAIDMFLQLPENFEAVEPSASKDAAGSVQNAREIENLEQSETTPPHEVVDGLVSTPGGTSPTSRNPVGGTSLGREEVLSTSAPTPDRRQLEWAALYRQYARLDQTRILPQKPSTPSQLQQLQPMEVVSTELGLQASNEIDLLEDDDYVVRTIEVDDDDDQQGHDLFDSFAIKTEIEDDYEARHGHSDEEEPGGNADSRDTATVTIEDSP